VDSITLIVFQAPDFNRLFKQEKYTRVDTTENIITRMQIDVMSVKDIRTTFPPFYNTRISLVNLFKKLIVDFQEK
jgi:hypothetical protein